MILGLDFASQTGWAHEDGLDPWFGTWDMRAGNAHPGRRFAELRKNLIGLYRARPFDRVVAEDASFGAAKNMLATMAFHNKMGGIVLATCSELGIPVTMVVPSQWKKWVRHGRLSKIESVNLAETIHGVKVRNDNEADAFWLLQYGIWKRQGGREATTKAKKPAKARAKTPTLFK